MVGDGRWWWSARSARSVPHSGTHVSECHWLQKGGGRGGEAVVPRFVLLSFVLGEGEAEGPEGG